MSGLLRRISGESSRRHARRGSLAIVDQVLSSGSGLLLMVLVAREAAPEAFGGLAVALLVHGLCFGSYRAMACEVTLLRRRRPATEDGTRLAIAMALGLGTVVAALLLGVAALVGGPTGSLLAVVAVASPFVYLQDMFRYLAYADGNLGRAVALDGCWLGVQAAISAYVLIAGHASATTLAAAWVAGAVVSAGLGWASTLAAPSLAGIRRWVREDGNRSVGFLVDHLVSTGVAQVSFLLVSLLVPLEEFGALRLAFVVVLPLANALAGVRVLVLSQLAGSELDRAAATARRAALALASIGAAYGLVLVVIPESIGVSVLGELWSDARTYLPFVAAAEVLRLSAFPAIDLVKVFDDPRRLVTTRAAVSASYLGGMLIGASLGGPLGAVMGLAAATVLGATLWWRRATSLHRPPGTGGAALRGEAAPPG